jgi:AI-2E family transporter
MLDKFASVTRATLKGTVLIGVAQGLLGGLAFWAVGIDGAIFWGTVMTVLSIVPGIGGALIWVPAAIILIATGEIWRGIALAGFCGLVIGSVDNLLRPLLVGRDTQMHELMIFFSTLGGVAASRGGAVQKTCPGRRSQTGSGRPDVHRRRPAQGGQARSERELALATRRRCSQTC